MHRPSSQSLFALVFAALCGLPSASSLAAELTRVTPDDPRLEYVGRWNFDEPARPWCAWQGCSVTVKFDGAALGVSMDVGGTEYFGVLVDDDIDSFRKFEATSGVGVYPLAAGLGPGPHKVELIRESYSGSSWEWQVRGFGVLDGQLLDPDPPLTRRIELYGDSNLAGTSNEDERDRWWARDVKTSTFVFAGIVARMFDAEYHNLSWGGATISSINARFDRMKYDTGSEPWDHARFPADVVVANIGANDVNRPKEAVKADYHAFLDDLRAVHPQAHVVLFNAWGWDFDEPANYTDEVIAERGDPNMSSAIFPWVFEQFHGCQYDQGGMAQVLADHLTAVLGWQQKPIDTLDGFGKNGDVANGSFEGVAPFGGWAWRYMEDAGVERVFDPAAAHDGDHYLELYDGAATHQPNPAVDGDVVTATVWMRGTAVGDRARLTIDFRNQQLWTDPLASHSDIVELTTDWQPFTVSATAPVGLPDPVFHTRLTIEAGPGSRIHVDSISQTTGHVRLIAAPRAGAESRP